MHFVSKLISGCMRRFVFEVIVLSQKISSNSGPDQAIGLISMGKPANEPFL